MAKISKFLQLDSRLLLEYTYDTYRQEQNTEDTEVSVITLKDNRKMLFLNPVKNMMPQYYAESFMFSSFPDATDSVWNFPGYVNAATMNTAHDDTIVQDLIKNGLLMSESISVPIRSAQLAFDTVKIHILSGYAFQDMEGFMLNIKASCINNSGNADEALIRNFTFFKGMSILSGKNSLIQYDYSPIYMSGKFYDRYISIQVPSIYFLGQQFDPSSNSSSIPDILKIDKSSNINIEFSEINNFTSENNPFRYIRGYDIYGQGTFTLKSIVSAGIPYNSNSDYFNAKLGIDQDNNCITYYTTWGNPNDDQPITQNIMNEIETGQIPLINNTFTDDSGNDYDTFYDMYGEDARKWIIINKLDITYLYSGYSYISSEIDQFHSLYTLERHQNFTNTEDFSIASVTDSDSNYKFQYRPVIPVINGYECTGMSIEYTARLMNRLNGSEIVRIASTTIQSPETIFNDNSKRINTDNIYKWVIYNKKNNSTIDASAFSQNKNQQSQVTKYVTKFYSNTNIIISTDSGNTASSTLFLYETAHTYLFTLYSDPDMSKPYILPEGTSEYLFVYNDKNGIKHSIEPTYSSNMNIISGTIEYSINSDMAAAILGGNMHYAVIIRNEAGTSTLFAGNIKSVY